MGVPPPSAFLYFIAQNVCGDPLSDQGAGRAGCLDIDSTVLFVWGKDWTAFGLKVIIQQDGK